MSLTRHDGKNAGSLKKLWIKLYSEITDTHTPADTHTDGLTISEDIELSGAWTQVEFVVGQASWQETHSEDASGETYSFNIQLSLHRDRQDITESLMRFSGRKIMAIAQDRNDEVNRLLGEKGSLYEYHARLTWNHVKEKTPGRNTYDISITCEMHHPACYYEGAIV